MGKQPVMQFTPLVRRNVVDVIYCMCITVNNSKRSVNAHVLIRQPHSRSGDTVSFPNDQTASEKGLDKSADSKDEK